MEGADTYHYLSVVQTNSGTGGKPIVVRESTTIGHYYEPIVVRASTNTGRPADLYRLLLRVGIKVADERQISLDYVRGSNIYVRGYLDLRAWSLRLRA